MSNSYVYVVIVKYKSGEQDIEGIYGDGMSALQYRAGSVAWTCDDEPVAFQGKPVHVGEPNTFTCRIEKWRVEE